MITRQLAVKTYHQTALLLHWINLKRAI